MEYNALLHSAEPGSLHFAYRALLLRLIWTSVRLCATKDCSDHLQHQNGGDFLLLNRIFPEECNFLPVVVDKHFLFAFKKTLGERTSCKCIVFFCIEIRNAWLRDS